MKKYSFDRESLVKVGKGALIAGGGAVATYLLTYLSQQDYGIYTPLLVSLFSIAINAVKAYIQGE